MNQRRIWSDLKVRAERRPPAEAYLGKTMEMEDDKATQEHDRTRTGAVEVTKKMTVGQRREERRA